jgi:uncharacterized protein YjdB
MKKFLLIIFLGINSALLFAQTVLTIEGTSEVNTLTGEWLGVDIPRGSPTILTYRNNSITSENTSGYMLQAGDEGLNSNANHLDGEIITGNKLIWNGTDMLSITHGVFTGYNINAVIKYNYLENVPMGLIRKSNGMTNTAGGVAYNIVTNPNVGFVAKGMNNVNVYNNTFYSARTTAQAKRGLVEIYTNTDNGLNAPSAGTKVKNNIFYTKYQIYNIYIYEAACLSGFESDYNVFYCEAGTPMFNYLGAAKTFAEWQALGYDTHSVIINPNFINFIDFVPAVRLNYGTDLGATWQSGLSVTAVWGTTDPATMNQNGVWQVGARIYYLPVTTINVTGAGGANTITTDNGTLQLSAEVLPASASDKSVTWSILNGTGIATISTSGLVTAVDNGTVSARAIANDGTGVVGSLIITISNQIVPVSAINVSAAGGANSITVENGTLQLNATVLPVYATNKAFTWSVVNGTGQASISPGGLVTAVADGTVTARATANDGSGVTGTMIISISKLVTGITVTGAGGANTITTDNGTLQLSAAILPVNATNQSVTWSIANVTGQATINSTGLVTAADNGTVIATATANDGSGVTGTLTITNSNQIVPVTGITVTGTGGVTTITTDNGALQLSAAILPANATNKSVTWTVINGTGQATINASGLLSAVANGTVTARATANDGSAVFGTLSITISIIVTGITVTGTGGATTITTDNGTLQLIVTVSPASAENKTVTWSITNGAGLSVINSSGLVTAVDNGTVTVRATANDGSGVYGTFIITNSNQIVPVTDITVTGAGGSNSINSDNGTLQLSVSVIPANATNKTVTWSITNGTGQATISTTGLVTAVDNGTVTARATANDGSGVSGTLIITNTNQIVPVTGITVSAAGGASTINSDNGTLQLSTTVLPSNATDKSVTWSVTNGTGRALISATGLVTAVDNGTVTARATANDGSGIFGTFVITNSNQLVPVLTITVTGAGGSTSITTDNGTLQLTALVLPVNAADKAVIWSVTNGSGQATINSTGLVTAVDNGTVTAIATAHDGSGVVGTLTITNSNQIVPVTGITVTGAGGAANISSDNGTLQLSALVLPVNASDKTVTWSIANGTGQATISPTGLVTAVDNGTVTARATANDGSFVSGTLIITISSQIVPVSGITVTAAGGVTSITIDNGTLQLSATVLPSSATNKTVTWSIINGTGQATINSSGLVTAVDNGTVTAIATANDGSGVYGSMIITNSNQFVPVTGIVVTGAAGETTIASVNGTLQLSAIALPTNATNKTVSWSVINGTGEATINSTGLLTAVSNGTVTARATANDGSGVFNILVITISGQIIYVNSIVVSGTGGVTAITTKNGTLQLIAEILPSNSTDKSVTWSITSGPEHAAVNSNGLLTATDNGLVTVRAQANDGSGVSGTITITISNQVIPVTGIIVTGPGGSYSVNMDALTLQLKATVFPANATDTTVTWSVENGTGQGTISSSGLVTAIKNGLVTARATANDGSGIYGTLSITISLGFAPSGSGENEPMLLIVSGYELKLLLHANNVKWNVSIFNFQGGLVKSKVLESDSLSFDISSLPAGIYLVTASKGDIVKISKFIKP